MATFALPASLANLPISILRKKYDEMTPEERRLVGLVRPATDSEAQQYDLLQQHGAPADFAGRVFPNPDNLQVRPDTDSGIEPTRLPTGVSFQDQNFSGKMPGDVSNPPRAKLGQTVDAKFDPDAPYETTDNTAKFDPDAPYETVTSLETAKAAPLETLGMLDREIPIDSYGAATLSGLQSVARGTRDAVKGMASLFAPPKDAAEHSLFLAQPGALPIYRTLRGLGHTAEEATQIAGAIRDINQSADPVGTYAKVAQETAGQGAGQALVALLTEGLARTAPKVAAVAPKVSSGVRTVVRGAAKTARAIDPDVVGIISPRAAHSLKVAQRAAKVAEKYTAEPGPLDLTESNVPYAGEEAPANVMAVRTAEAPATTTSYSAPSNAVAARAQAVDTSPKVVGQQLEEALGGKKLVPGVPLKNQPSAMGAKLPKGFTPVESSALKGYKYDPTAREFESVTSGGQHYIHGDVSPEAAQTFAAAESKGKAWQQIRENPLVAKVVNGKRIPVTKSMGLRSSTPEQVSPEASLPAGYQKSGPLSKPALDLENKWFQQARAELGKDAPLSKVLTRAQEMKEATMKKPAASEDLTELLQKSLEAARKKKR